jgi:hypothetical protein
MIKRRTGTNTVKAAQIARMNAAIDATTKPRCQLTGTDGNIFALGAKAGAGLHEQILDMQHRICTSKSYDEALRVIMDYVDVE